MNVIDLWSDKNRNKVKKKKKKKLNSFILIISQFLGNCKLIKDKLVLNKLVNIKKKKGYLLDEKKPKLLTRKEEINLIKNIYMNEQSKMFQEKCQKRL